MNESGASISEIRTLAAQIEGHGPDDAIMDRGGSYYKAILVEALLCLAAKREAERAKKVA
jgi:hypothetical protein